MRQSFIITGIALGLSLGVAGMAAAQGTGQPMRPNSATPDSGRRGPGGRGGQEAMLLRGITLTADQQTRLRQLGESRRQQMEAERARGDNASARPPREGGDTTGMGAWRAQMERRRDEQIAALRGILTDEQRVQFDKNVAEMKARGAERARTGGGERPDRDR